MCVPARIREETQQLKAFPAYAVYTYHPGAASEQRGSWAHVIAQVK